MYTCISRTEIKRIIDSYDNWYQRICFGFMLETRNRSTNPTDEFLRECHFWLRKILRRSTREDVFLDSLPDLTGKRVIDIGCNAGFKSLEASCKGAAFVLGVDRNPVAIRQANDMANVFRGLAGP